MEVVEKIEKAEKVEEMEVVKWGKDQGAPKD